MKVDQPVPASQVREAILRALPGRVSEIAPKLGRKRTDSTIRARLKELEAEGVIANDRGVWSRIETDPIAALPGFEGYEFPEGFDEEARDEFRLKARELVEAEVPIDSFAVDLVENYVRCLLRARIANRNVDRDGLFQRAAKGNRKFPHPGIAIAREAERDAHVYRVEIEKKKRKEPVEDADPDDDLAGLGVG